jgi:hypothetical protein
MTCQSLFGVGDGEGVGVVFALAEDLAVDFFVDALDLAAIEGEASANERRPAMARKQSRRLIILYKVQEKCHFANRMPFGDGMGLGRSKIVEQFSRGRHAPVPWGEITAIFRGNGVASQARSQTGFGNEEQEQD